MMTQLAHTNLFWSCGEASFCTRSKNVRKREIRRCFGIMKKKGVQSLFRNFAPALVLLLHVKMFSGW